MTKAAPALRIGCVKYLNALPLIHGWDGPVTFAHPSTLCRQLSLGELDAALVSAFEYLRAPDYAIVDDIAVAANGAVHSVFVAHQGPLEEVTAISLDPASATSVNLLRCLLAERGLRVELTSGPAAARLLIGDQALAFRAEQAGSFHYWDLAAEWKRATGLPFVFALWLIRPEVAEPGILAARLRARRDANLAALDQVIAAQQTAPPDFARFYFEECLHFHLGDDEKAGLLRFRSLCQQHGILPANAGPLRLV